MAVVLLSGHLLNEALLLPHDYPILLTASVLAQCPVAGFPGNWWAKLMSIPSINGSLLLPEYLRWLLGTMRCCSRTLLWTHKAPLCTKLLISLLLFWSSFFGLEAGQSKACRPAGCSPTTAKPAKAEETAMNAEISGNVGGECKVLGESWGGHPWAMWDPVATDHHERCLLYISPNGWNVDTPYIICYTKI